MYSEVRVPGLSSSRHLEDGIWRMRHLECAVAQTAMVNVTRCSGVGAGSYLDGVDEDDILRD